MTYSRTSQVTELNQQRSKTLRPTEEREAEQEGKKQREKTGRGEAGGRQEKPKTGSLNEFIEKRPGIGTDTPHHTTVETLTSQLSVSLSAITLSLPPSPASLHLL